MTVTLREIRRLQDKVAEEIKELKENPDADYDRLAELRTLSFNISMVFLRYSMEKDSTEIELGPADSKIVSALKPFKQEQEKKQEAETERKKSATMAEFVDNICTLSKDCLDEIVFMKESLELCRNKIFRQNLEIRLESALKGMEEIYSLRTDAKKLSLWKNEVLHGREDAAKLTPQSAYSRYRKILSSAGAEIIYIGKDMPLQNKDKLLAPFRSLEREFDTFDAIKRSPLKTEIASRTERLSIMQSKMILAFKTSFEDQAAMRMFSALYGETPVSKLFSNVREKLSLCYYCPCGFKDDRKGVLFVDCGVEHDNLEPAKKEILAQLEEIRKGNFTDDEINSARLAIINSLKGINDIPSRIANRYMNRFITGQEVISPEKEIERIKAVTKDDIIAAAESVRLDTVYILTGKE